MTKYFYVVDHGGESCGHQHADLTGGTLARCAATARKRAPKGWRPDVWVCNDDGSHARAPREARAALANVLPARGAGRPAGQKPRIEQASPLYARLSVAERARYEALARAAGVPDLGAWALALMEREAARSDAA